MKKMFFSFCAMSLLLSFPAAAQLDLKKAKEDLKKKEEEIIKKAKEEDVVKKATDLVKGEKPLTNDEVVQGLKEALSIGSQHAADSVAKPNGFYKNPALKIPFPPEAKDIKAKLIKLGMQKQVDKFELTLNQAAEEAAKEAAPIFLDAIKNMSVADGFQILRGADTAATHYLKDSTSKALHGKFKPVVIKATKKVELTKYWNPLATKYNKIPGVKKQNPDLDEYVTQRAMAALFQLVAAEELKIRKDPLARVTDLLKKVFGSEKK